MSINPFNTAERPIIIGHGEYIVYHQNNTGEKVAPSRFTYDAAYEVLNHHNHPSSMRRSPINT